VDDKHIWNETRIRMVKEKRPKYQDKNGLSKAKGRKRGRLWGKCGGFGQAHMRPREGVVREQKTYIERNNKKEPRNGDCQAFGDIKTESRRAH